MPSAGMAIVVGSLPVERLCGEVVPLDSSGKRELDPSTNLLGSPGSNASKSACAFWYCAMFTCNSALVFWHILDGEQ